MFYLYRLLIFVICFEEIFSRLIFPLKYCKYLIVAFTIILILHKKNWRFSFPIKTFWGKCFIVITIISTIISIPFFLDYGWMGFDVPKKYLFFPILAICFYYAPLFGCSIKQLLFFYAKVMLFYSILNPILYFLKLPIWNSSGYWGRISVGYPTIDVVSYAIAIAIFLFGNMKIHWAKQALASFIIASGIIMQVSGTGIVLLAVIFIFSIAFEISDKIHGTSENLGKKILLLLALVAFSIPVGYGILYTQRPVLLQDMEWHLENRLSLMLQGGQYSSDVNTMDIRKDEYKIAEKEYQNELSLKIFGVGFGPVNFSPSTNVTSKKTVFLESQYHLTLFTSGFLGVAILLLAVAEIIIKAYKNKDRLLIIIGTLFICTFGTVNPLMSFSLVGILSLCYVQIFSKGHDSGNN